MRRTIIRVPARSASKLAGGVAIAIGFSGLAFVVYGPVTPTKAAVRQVRSAEVAAQPEENVVVLASPGRIEGASDSLDVGAAMDGVIRSIYVTEGQRVSRGQVLAGLDCRELQSALPVAESEAESSRQVRERLLRGSRKEEREAAAQRTIAAKAVLAQATLQVDRLRELANADAVSRSSLDEALRDAGVAEAEYQRALRNEELVNAGPLTEEVAKADADLQAAEKRIELGHDKLAKCVIRAPIDGTVLRITLRQGESFALVAPRPVLTIADISGRRVCAEVDERDVGKVHIGQQVVVSSEGFAGQRFTGTVTRVAALMGRKSIITGDPADKNDRDVLEVTAQLEPAATALPVGLRATVQFRR
jgi:ABC exporter DevB family membrane fusion protein